MPLTRRGLLSNTAALAALSSIGWHPKLAQAAQGERKFLFFFASGAWDTTTVFDPHYGTEFIDMDPETYPSEIGRLIHTGGPDRANTEMFFQRWGRRSCIVNGIDAHSVGQGYRLLIFHRFQGDLHDPILQPGCIVKHGLVALL